MKKKLYVGYDDYNNIYKTRDFEIVEKVPEVGDHWSRTCEVIGVEEVHLDMENSTAFPEEYKAYKVEYINRGCEEEREDPFVDYIAIVVKYEDNKMDFKDFQKAAIDAGIQNDDKQVWVNVEGKQYTVDIDDVLDEEEKEPFEASFYLEKHLDAWAWDNLYYDQYLADE